MIFEQNYLITNDYIVVISLGSLLLSLPDTKQSATFARPVQSRDSGKKMSTLVNYITIVICNFVKLQIPMPEMLQL